MEGPLKPWAYIIRQSGLGCMGLQSNIPRQFTFLCRANFIRKSLDGGSKTGGNFRETCPEYTGQSNLSGRLTILCICIFSQANLSGLVTSPWLCIFSQANLSRLVTSPWDLYIQASQPFQTGNQSFAFVYSAKQTFPDW